MNLKHTLQLADFKLQNVNGVLLIHVLLFLMAMRNWLLLLLNVLRRIRQH